MVTMAGFSSGSCNSHIQTMLQSSVVKGAGWLNGSTFDVTPARKIPLDASEDDRNALIEDDVDRIV